MKTLLTDINHVYIHGVRERSAQCVGGHHSDVVVHPEGCVVLVEEAGVFSSCVVVRTLEHRIRAARDRGEQHLTQRALCDQTVTVCISRTACIHKTVQT